MTETGRVMRGHRSDLVLAMGIFALLGIGLIMMYSISPVVAHSYRLFFNQLLYVLLGLVVWVVVANIPYPTWQRWAPGALLLAGLSVFLLIPFGRSSLGATRWVQLGPISFQPAELLKIALILYLAMWLVRRGQQLTNLTEGVLPFSLIVGIAGVVVVVFQRDLGTAAVLMLAAVGMYFLAGLRWSHLVLIFMASVILVGAAIVAAPHRVGRLTTFLHPGQDPTGAGYHINQAMIGIGSGGLLGNGLGHSIQVYGYLPEATTDSIFAVMAEEFGLIGCLIIFALYALVIYRGLMIAATAPDQFSRLLAGGIALWFGSQALINIGAMLSLVPLTGIPLPYVSYGGTNLVVSLIGAGMLMNISRYTTREEGYAPTRQRGRNGRARLASSGYDRRPQAV